MAEPIDILERLAYNLRWTWHTPTSDLFCRIAPQLWSATHNPVDLMRAAADTPSLLIAHAELVDSACSPAITSKLPAT